MALILYEHNIVDEYNEISQEDKDSLEVLNFVAASYRAGLSVKITNKPPVKQFIESPEVTNTVKSNIEASSANQFIRQAASGEYKRVSEDLEKVNEVKKPSRKKSMKELMQQSVFHGKNWMGSNFIA